MSVDTSYTHAHHTTMSHDIKVTGHRGAAKLKPENTLAGFALAQSLGCDAVELDVHLTADGQLAVIHDSTLDRTTNGTGNVKDFTLEELQRLDAGDGDTIPSLSQVFDLFGSSEMIIQIELKGDGTAAPAARLVEKAGMAERIRFTSFHHRRVLEAKTLLPVAQAGILIGSNPVDPGSMLEATKANYLHVNANKVDKALIEAVRTSGGKTAIWGVVEDLATIDRLIKLEVDAIGSNLPNMVLKRLAELGLR